jgi:transposase
MVDFSAVTDLKALQSAANQQQQEILRLHKVIERLHKQIATMAGGEAGPMQQELDFLKDLLRRREDELFGASSEKRKMPKGEKPDADKAPRRGHGPTEQTQLRVIEQRHELPVDQRICPACGDDMVAMGDQTEDAEEITVVLREFLRVLHRRQKYRCGCNGHVATAPGPLKLQPGSRYSPAFAVEVAQSKYLDHMPLERQVRAMSRLGLQVTSQTLWDQVNALANHLKPTYEAILAAILKAPLLHADETKWPMLDGGRVSDKKTWWVWCAATSDLVGYRILDSRGADSAKTLLGGYEGIVMADGLSAYEALCRNGPQTNYLETGPPTRFRLVSCWTHARRKFVEAEPNFPECKTVLDLIGELYEIERKAAFVENEAARLKLRAELRQAHSRTLIEAIFEWTDKTPALPESGLGKALTYLRNHKTGLTAFLDDARIPLDNNHAERALRRADGKGLSGCKGLRGWPVA